MAVTHRDDLNISGETGNRLAGETSPYLLSHPGNPVYWQPRDGEAFKLARTLGGLYSCPSGNPAATGAM